MANNKDGDKVFILYDARARLGDTEDATVFLTVSSEKEAWADSRDYQGQGAVWYEYTFKNGEAINETLRADIGKGIL